MYGELRGLTYRLPRAGRAGRRARLWRALSAVNVNGRGYRLPHPWHPVVAICLDGLSPEFLDAASAAGISAGRFFMQGCSARRFRFLDTTPMVGDKKG